MHHPRGRPNGGATQCKFVLASSTDIRRASSVSDCAVSCSGPHTSRVLASTTAFNFRLSGGSCTPKQRKVVLHSSTEARHADWVTDSPGSSSRSQPCHYVPTPSHSEAPTSSLPSSSSSARANTVTTCRLGSQPPARRFGCRRKSPRPGRGDLCHCSALPNRHDHSKSPARSSPSRETHHTYAARTETSYVEVESPPEASLPGLELMRDAGLNNNVQHMLSEDGEHHNGHSSKQRTVSSVKRKVGHRRKVSSLSMEAEACELLALTGRHQVDQAMHHLNLNPVTFRRLLKQMTVQGRSQAGSLRQTRWVFDSACGPRIAVQVNALHYNMMIAAYSRNKQLDNALELFETMEGAGCWPDVITYSTLITACMKSGHGHRAIEYFEEMKARGIKPDVTAYTAVMHACEKERQHEAACGLLDEMLDRGLRPDLVCFSAAIAACNKAAQWRQALQLFHQMRAQGIEPNAITYSSLLAALARAKQWRRTLLLFENMKQEGVAPNHFTYTCVISACAKGRQLQRALELFEEMQVEGIMPNVVVFNSLLSACERACNPTVAAQVIDRMAHAQVKPDDITFNTLISLYANMGDLSMAEEMLEQMRGASIRPSVVTFNSLIRAHHPDTHLNRAFKVVHRMRRQGLKPDDVTVLELVNMCDRNKNWRKAVRAFQSMEAWGVPGSQKVFNALISACRRQYTVALGMFVEMRQRGIPADLVTYNSLLSACLFSPGREQWERGSEVLDMMVTSGIKPDVTTYSALIFCCSKVGRMLEALEVYDTMKAKGVIPNIYTFNSLIRTCKRAKRLDLAKGFWQEMQALGIQPDVDTWTDMISLYCYEEQWNDVDAALAKVDELGLKIRRALRFKVEKAVVAAQEDRKRDEKTANAMKVLQKLKKLESYRHHMHQQRAKGVYVKLNYEKLLTEEERSSLDDLDIGVSLGLDIFP